VEPTGKVFPVSNKAGDVLAALLSRLDVTEAFNNTGKDKESV
jgi:hypothetical protein